MLTSKLILQFISQEDIFNRYFGAFQFKKYYTNPWRDDKKPNCWFTYRNTVLYFVDFANDIKNISCFQACMYHYNCDFKQALTHIDIDFCLNLSTECLFKNCNNEINLVQNNIKNTSYDTRKTSVKNNTLEEKVKYEFIYQNFTSYDIKLWKEFHFTKELVDLMKIKSVKKLYRNGILYAQSAPQNPIYTYSDLSGEFKISRPLSSKALKWRCLRPVIEGFDLLIPDDILFITSSYKDVGTLKLLGYQAVSPSSESSYNLLYEKMDYFKKNYNYIYVFHNNDETGKTFSLKITKDHSLNYINIPNNEPKDPSDYSKFYNLDKLDILIKEKFKRDGIKSKRIN